MLFHSSSLSDRSVSGLLALQGLSQTTGVRAVAGFAGASNPAGFFCRDVLKYNTLPPMEVENGVLEDVWLVSKWVIFHFHDYGRKGNEIKNPLVFEVPTSVRRKQI